MDVRRVLPLSGIAFVAVVLIAVVGIGGSTPTTGDSPESMFDFYDEQTVRQAIASFVFAASVPFLVFFAISLASAFRDRRGESAHLWRQVVVAGGVLTGRGSSPTPGSTSPWPTVPTTASPPRRSRPS